MTTPTKAQTEAAVAFLENLFGRSAIMKIDFGKLVETVRTIAAAAGVPAREHILPQPGQQPHLLPNGNTAAEEGGLTIEQSVDVAERFWKSEKAATIERCAQVLDEYFGSSENLLSRRIRALQDNP